MKKNRISFQATILAATALISMPSYAGNSESNYADSQNFIRTAVSNSTAPIDFTKAAENTINCVVSIQSFATPRQSRMQGFNDPFFEFFFGPDFGSRQQRRQRDAQPQPLGLGSGVIISNDGYIVTNNHVVEGAEKLEVTLNDNKKYNATIIGTDSNTDLALLKIDAKDLTFITFGDSDELKVGEWVLAVGNPFGFTSTVTAGIVSAKARNVSSISHNQQMGIESFIQTDAVVNQGNSGGALVNTRGELVGINTLIYSRTGDYSGYAFAIPTSIVKKVVTDLRQYGTVQRALLGISFVELTPSLCEKENITEVTKGIYVAEVQDQSAAKEAGIEKGDVIVAINDTRISGTADMQETISRFSPGDKATVKFYRDNKAKTVTVVFKNSQGGTSINKRTDFTALGCAFLKLNNDTKEALHISHGVEVTGLTDGIFKNAGIKEGLIILEINNMPVDSQDDVENIYDEIMRSQDADKVMIIKGLQPTGKRVYFAVPLYEEEN